MNKARYEYLCQESEAGRETLIEHPSSHEDGVIVSCLKLTDTLVVRTLDGYSRSWDFHDCDDLTHH